MKFMSFRKFRFIAATLLAVAAPALLYSAALTTFQKLRIQQAVNDKALGTKISNRLDAIDGVVKSVSYTVAAESGNNVDIQAVFKDADGTAVTYPFSTYCWTSDASTGVGVVATAATSAFSAVTYGVVESITSGKSARVTTDASGRAGVRNAQTSNTVPDFYLCCSIEGATSCSGAGDH